MDLVFWTATVCEYNNSGFSHSCYGCIVLLLEKMCAKYTASDSRKKTISILKDDNELAEDNESAFDGATF